MKITEDVRAYAAKLELDEKQALTRGLAEKSKEFTEKGSEIYQKV